MPVPINQRSPCKIKFSFEHKVSKFAFVAEHSAGTQYASVHAFIWNSTIDKVMFFLAEIEINEKLSLLNYTQPVGNNRNIEIDLFFGFGSSYITKSNICSKAAVRFVLSWTVFICCPIFFRISLISTKEKADGLASTESDDVTPIHWTTSIRRESFKNTLMHSQK